MNSGKIVADGTGGKFEGSTRGPRGPKKDADLLNPQTYQCLRLIWFHKELEDLMKTSLLNS